MKVGLIAASVGLAAALVGAGAVRAATVVSFSSYQVALNPGETLVTDFSNPLTTAPGYGLSGTGSLITGTSGADAAPAFSPGSFDPGQYLSVEANQSETLTTPGVKYLSFYVGSLDTYNSFTFTFEGGDSETFTGADLAALTGAGDNGDQSGAGTNGRLTFDFGADRAISVELDSTENSFEIANIGASAVPEPAAWAMMLVGFFGLGGMLRNRRSVLALAA